MSGVLANAASRTMLAAESSADKAVSGFVALERIVLSTNPAGSSYSWGLSIPQGSVEEKSGLSSATAAAPTFMPDVAGEYLATCTVDGSISYVLRMSVTRTTVATTQEALRLQSKTNASVPAPPTGSALYHSEEFGQLASKESTGTARRIGRSLRASGTWDPPSVADGAVASTTIAVSVAAIGDRVSVGFSNAIPAGAILAGNVTLAGVVTCTLFNKTGAPLDLASGTLTVDVWQ